MDVLSQHNITQNCIKTLINLHIYVKKELFVMYLFIIHVTHKYTKIYQTNKTL